jgi:hypothetical protein
MKFLKGTLDNQVAFNPTEKLKLAFIEKGYPVEKVEGALIIKTGSFSQLFFQTIPGRVQWESVILRITDKHVSYCFVYRFWLQVVMNLIATGIAFLALTQKNGMSNVDLLESLVMVNALVLVVSLANAQHSRHYILKTIRTVV